MSVHIRLRLAMQEANVSTTDLATSIGVSISRVSQFLAGDEMRQSQIIAICDRLKISTDWLLRGCQSKNEQEAEMMTAYRRLSPEIKESIIKIAKACR